MQSEIKNIVIVGGGTAGWLTAGLIAAKHQQLEHRTVTITVVESPNIQPIGVGEGTWPSMRDTLKRIGIEESQLFTCCDASFKQASKFINWTNATQAEFEQSQGVVEHTYYHPFSLPTGTSEFNLGSLIGPQVSQKFAEQVCFQTILCELNLAPKNMSLKGYEYIANYGYHLDATKFSELLKNHCVNQLNVKHVVSHITEVINNDEGDIAHVATQTHGNVSGDLFIDCSGAQSLLLGKHFNVPFCSQKHVLFNDSALAAQVPYQHEDDPIASCTLSTAQRSGWIWNIGLQSRRGIGYVYSSQHSSDSEAEEELRKYIASLNNGSDTPIRKLSFNPGYYEKFWHRNCVAVGMSAGFIEPLEASALAMIEQAAQMISEQLPKTKRTMQITAKRFNSTFNQHWQQIIEFLKLHYVLSSRNDSDYWIENKASSSIPESLQEMLELWKYQAPSSYDVPHAKPLFPAASYQYILYGMQTSASCSVLSDIKDDTVNKLLLDVQKKRQTLAAFLDPNRVLINKIKQFGLATI